MYSDVDQVARHLIHMGRMARNMPPSWDAAKVQIPVVSHDGQLMLGKALPGRGLFLHQDLKELGITKKLPNVFERSRIQRAMEFCRGHERMAVGITAGLLAASLWPKSLLNLLGPSIGAAITTYDGIINARSGGSTAALDFTFSKLSIPTLTSNWSALFDVGGFPAAGTFTGTPGAAVDKTTTGALSFGIPALTGSNKCYILTFGYTSGISINMSILADLLVQVGAITVAGTGATVNSAALTRYTGAVGVSMTWEVTTALGATPSNLTVTYTNQAGTASRSTGAVALTASAIAGRLQPTALGPLMTLQSGDTGVQSVQTATTSANMAAGALALHLYYPLAWVPGIAANIYVERDSTVQIDGITELTNVSGTVGCLTLYFLAGGSSSGGIAGFVRACQG